MNEFHTETKFVGSRHLILGRPDGSRAESRDPGADPLRVLRVVSAQDVGAGPDAECRSHVRDDGRQSQAQQGQPLPQQQRPLHGAAGAGGTHQPRHQLFHQECS